MRTSIATVSISGGLAEKLEAIAAAGFEGVEIFENDLLAFEGTPREAGRRVRELGLELTLFQPFRDFEGMPPQLRARNFDRAERKFDLMQELGAPLMLVCSNVSTAALGGIDRAAEDFHALGERAAKRGLKVGYEALAWGRHVSDHRDAWEVVRRADHPAIGLILDSFHTLARKIDVATIRAIPADKIFIVQLADAPRFDMDPLHWSRHFRNMPGEGDLPVLDFARAVAATGYDGWWSLEIFNDQFRGGAPKSIAVDGKRSLIYLTDQVRRSEPDLSGSFPDMPPRIEASGVAFLEFTASEAEAERLSGLLHALGFRRTGRHVSKAVTRWQQGDINLVLNTEQTGFAHSAWLTHGTSVCAVGLKVTDASAAVARAAALDAQTFSQPIGPGELPVPAIRGVAGSLLYFIDDASELKRVWEVEFQPVAGDRPVQDAGLLAVDHIAQTMNYDQMLSWLLFYTSIFAVEKTPMLDIVDPSGLIRSQVIESRSGSLRITLNGAENRNTLAGRFMEESFGSAVQHLAFASRDIFATAAAWRANGLEPLTIPGNYFDDLEARFGLDADLSDRLCAANVLYDRDERGEYFQLYSPLYHHGFFFEVVERRGYSGYGAANAPFRIAAQKRQMQPRSPS